MYFISIAVTVHPDLMENDANKTLMTVPTTSVSTEPDASTMSTHIPVIVKLVTPVNFVNTRLNSVRRNSILARTEQHVRIIPVIMNATVLKDGKELIVQKISTIVLDIFVR